jgi:release factor glutamine methyltransferase
MCTGSGCIAITLYLELIKRGINIDVTATDISSEALKVTQKNASSLIEEADGDNNTFHIIESDLFSNVSKNKKFDIIVSNPPYIPTLDIEKLEDEVRLHDPVMALDGDNDGLKFYRAIIDKSLDYIKPTGLLAFEMGFDQGDAVSKLMDEKGYMDIHIYKDLGGLDRVIIGRNH